MLELGEKILNSSHHVHTVDCIYRTSKNLTSCFNTLHTLQMRVVYIDALEATSAELAKIHTPGN